MTTTPPTTDDIEYVSANIPDEGETPQFGELTGTSDPVVFMEVQENPDKVYVQPLTKKKATPLPIPKIFSACIILFLEGFIGTSLFPYVAFMVKHFQILNDDEVPIYVGILIASFFVAQFLTGVLWGRLSDWVGKRPVLIVSLTGNVISLIVFGFSVNYIMAVVSRFFQGSLNGSIGVTKAFIGDVCDSTNQPKAFMFAGFAFGLGSALGPFLGGLLSMPLEQYPILLNLGVVVKPLEWFPFLLPNIVLVVAALLGLVFTILFVNSPKDDIAVAQLKITISRLFKQRRGRKHYVQQPSPPDRSPVSLNVELLDASNKLDQGEASATEMNNVESPPQSLSSQADQEQPEINLQLPQRKKAKVSMLLLLRKDPIITTLLYALLGLCDSAFSTTFPLLCVASVSVGGFSLNSQEIGYISGIAGATALVFQLLTYGFLVRRIGLLRFLQVCFLVAVLPPTIISFAGLLDFFRVLLWIVAILSSTVRQTAVLMSYTSSNSLINNSVPPELMGTVNGLGQSLIALCRAVSPALSALIFSLSLRVGVFPIDIHLIFILQTGLFIVMFVISLLLRSSINRPVNRR